ncbi:MAG: acyl-CoA thioesterase [Bacteroidota bacterium]|nr:acyl-CoA thioesterase [Bacteroidota bacterium]
MELIATKICKASDIGIYNNLFGGTMLSWLDEAGGTMASAKCCTPNIITLKIDEVVFKKPVKVNEHIRLYGKIDRIGNTSIALYLEARRFDFEEHEENMVCSTRMTFVRIDQEGNAIPIEKIIRDKYKNY